MPCTKNWMVRTGSKDTSANWNAIGVFSAGIEVKMVMQLSRITDNVCIAIEVDATVLLYDEKTEEID